MQVWTQAVLPGFLVRMPRKPRKKRRPKPVPPTVTFRPDDTYELALWAKYHNVPRWEAMSAESRQAVGFYECARVLWFSHPERDQREMGA